MGLTFTATPGSGVVPGDWLMQLSFVRQADMTGFESREIQYSLLQTHQTPKSQSPECAHYVQRTTRMSRALSYNAKLRNAHWSLDSRFAKCTYLTKTIGEILSHQFLRTLAYLQPQSQAPTSSLHSIVPIYSLDESTSEDEDEVHLFDVPPSQTPDANPTGNLAGTVKELAEIAFEKFLVALSPVCRSARGGKDRYLSERTRKWLRTCCFEKHTGKERRSGADDEDTVNSDPPTLTTKHLICPFYLRYKERHLSCLTRADLREIKDLKRHLWTAHRQPSYCPICYDTFVLAKDWEIHGRRGSCASSGRPRPEGISVLQMQRLSRRAGPRVSREAQWLLIWEIVFPGVKPPSLTFRPNEVEVVVWVLRDFWSADGDRIVSTFLTERRQQSPQLQAEELNVATLRPLVLNRVIDGLVTNYRQDGTETCRSRGLVRQALSSLSSFRPG
ncbi:hypothetical protein NUW58_g3868 [Xylaria curta]|uniref:Uncharacterized protein n=1 Tax=Xylaria curta TaxID=42375 RepID=A0ACC1P912_9PEZI|nr:hypothetical protein NUW58_g3868 [Xylaria curta]